MGMLDGKVAWITGAGRGQGRAHALRLAGEGAAIVATELCETAVPGVAYALASTDDLEETAALVRARGGRIETHRGDVRKIAEMRAAAKLALDAFGRLDIVVANAGVAVFNAGEMDDEEAELAFDTVVDINLKGVWNTVRAAAPVMIEQGQGGSIILISSTAGLKGLSSPGALGSEGYGASKHGVVGLMRHFAVSLGGNGIRVNTIHPTGVYTKMIDNPAMEKFLAAVPAAGSSLKNLMPVEVLQPEDIADSVLYLASDLSRYVTGVTLSVDAGFNVKP